MSVNIISTKHLYHPNVFVDANYLQREQMMKENFSETNIATSVKLQLPPSYTIAALLSIHKHSTDSMLKTVDTYFGVGSNCNFTPIMKYISLL